MLATHYGVVRLTVSDISDPQNPYQVTAYLYVNKDGQWVLAKAYPVPLDGSETWRFSYSGVSSYLEGIAEGQYDCGPIDSHADAKAYWSTICPTCIGGAVLSK